jgi:hypothetical protein
MMRRLYKNSANNDVGNPLIKVCVNCELDGTCSTCRTPSETFTSNEMNVKLNASSATMLYSCRQRNIITLHNGGIVKWAAELNQEMTNPTCLSNGCGNCTIPQICTATRNYRLMTRWSRNQIVTQKNVRTWRWVASIRAPSPVDIGIGNKIPFITKQI